MRAQIPDLLAGLTVLGRMRAHVRVQLRPSALQNLLRYVVWRAPCRLRYDVRLILVCAGSRHALGFVGTRMEAAHSV